MNITVLMQVFNEEKFLDICLSKLIEYAHKIIIVEGAVKHFWPIAGENGTSTDRTWGIIQHWAGNHSDKIVGIKARAWNDKTELKTYGLKYVPQETNYLHIVDADEIYERSSLERIKEILELERPDYVKVAMTRSEEHTSELQSPTN